MKILPKSFGSNWIQYINLIDENKIDIMVEDLKKWINFDLSNMSFLDIGCGSGLSSLAFEKLGINDITCFDADEDSVESAKIVNSKFSKKKWNIFKASVLDKKLIDNIEKKDFVYSWGVLHHTGEMWKAMANASSLVKKNGYFLIAIYTKGPNYQNHLNYKIRFKNGGFLTKKYMIYLNILGQMKSRLMLKKNPFKWNRTKRRGMNVYHDILDWLVGLPYEVASPSEVENFCKKLSFKLIKSDITGEAACSQYLFRKE